MSSQRWIDKLDGLLGGPARRRVIVLLAGVLALDSADKATVGASAVQLQQALGIGKTSLALLVALSSGIGALATLPFGVLVDRVRRTRLLVVVVSLWSVAMLAGGASTSYWFLLGTRIFLGGVTAAAAPAVASLTGDYFPATDRGRVYGFILSGELIGVGFGFVVAGNLATFSWRWSFWVLALPALLLAWRLHRLPEPDRGGASQIRVGQQHLGGAPDRPAQQQDGEPPARATQQRGAEPADTDGDTLAVRAVENADVEPRPGLVLTPQEVTGMTLWRATRYVLRIRTNVVLIVASALGYFFLSGVRTFGVEFLRDHFGLGPHLATTAPLALGVGALVGVLAGGRVGDRLLREGRVSGRVLVAAVSLAAAAALFLPAILVTSALLGLGLLVVAAGCLGAINPPLDAARLDIMPAPLWGRAEAVRTVLRQGAEAVAPLLFGYLAQHLLGGGQRGLTRTFLVMLAPLALAAAVALVGVRTYPRDVATADVTTRRLRDQDDPAPS